MPEMSGSPREELRDRIDLVEEAYEFFLAYAAQGLEDDRESGAGGELRSYLDRLDRQVGEIGPLLAEIIENETVPAPERLHDFREVVESDAGKAGAALRLVAAQPSVSSQLIDNLNASMHLRALLTDLFLLDEILDLGVPEATGAGAEPGD